MVSKLIVYLFFKCVHFYKYNAEDDQDTEILIPDEDDFE